MMAYGSNHRAASKEFVTFNNQTIKALKPHLSPKLKAEAEARRNTLNSRDKDNSLVIFLPHCAERREELQSAGEREFDLAEAD